MHHPLRDLHGLGWPVALTLALVAAAGVLANLTGVSP